MQDTHHELAGEAAQSFVDAYVAMQTTAAPNWLELDLTLPQLRGVFVLAREGSMAISELARLLRIGNPAASMLVDRLVRLGLVERAEDPTDRRRTIARLTSEAAEQVMGLQKDKLAQLQGWTEQLTDTELSALMLGMQALARVVAAQPTRSPALAGG
jgi:MarR family transcriptional regulator, organic hydroperoxide resistance regulator